ncbi:MAG: hypothetical protein ACPGXK_07270 [Phycisphaerae bacterium]
MGESRLHLELKRAAARWMWDAGYAAIAPEVKVPGVGIIDVAGAGKYRRRNPRRTVYEQEERVDRHHVVFIECKAYRSDFLRDQGDQMQFAFAVTERAARRRARRPGRHRHASPALGKFDTCLVRPHANLHYVLTPPKLIKKTEIPRRWGLLVLDHGYVRTIKKASWFETAETSAVEGAIARALTHSSIRSLSQRHDTMAPDPNRPYQVPPETLPFAPRPFRMAR